MASSIIFWLNEIGWPLIFFVFCFFRNWIWFWKAHGSLYQCEILHCNVGQRKVTQRFKIRQNDFYLRQWKKCKIPNTFGLVIRFVQTCEACKWNFFLFSSREYVLKRVGYGIETVNKKRTVHLEFQQILPATFSKFHKHFSNFSGFPKASQSFISFSQVLAAFIKFSQAFHKS